MNGLEHKCFAVVDPFCTNMFGYLLYVIGVHLSKYCVLSCKTSRQDQLTRNYMYMYLSLFPFTFSLPSSLQVLFIHPFQWSHM